MQTGRADLDAMIKVSTIPGDEPVFILRARDPAAPYATRAWAAAHMAMGGQAANAESAMDQADRMEAWPTKKTPGADHWTENERLQLEYKFSRRARLEGLTTDPEAEMLAERRGFDLAHAASRAFLVSDMCREICSIPALELVDYAQRRRRPGDPELTPLELRGVAMAWLLAIAFERGASWRAVAELELDQHQHRLEQAMGA